MDEIIKKWTIFLEQDSEEEEQVEPASYQIYCDMDGVLVDLIKGIEDELVSSDLPKEIIIKAILVLNSGEVWEEFDNSSELGEGSQAIYDILNNQDYDERLRFWTYLPMKSDADDLWKYIKLDEHDPIILSAPWRLPNGDLDKACIQGKKNWVERMNLNPKNIIITPDKHVYAKTNSILIDDMDKYIIPWASEGGIPIKHTSTKKTITVLRDLLENKN